MSAKMFCVYVAVAIPVCLSFMAILALAAFFGAVSGAVTATSNASANAGPPQQRAVAIPATDPHLLEVLAQNSGAITRMAENQQETTKALQQNTAVLQQFVVQQQERQTAPVASTPCNGCGRGEYLEVPPSR